MPAIFHKRNGHWSVEPIAGVEGALRLAPAQFDPSSAARGDAPSDGLLARIAPEGPWVLLTRGDRRLTHNGRVVAAGIRVLAHMDALAVDGGEAAYFSTEETASIAPFAGSSAVSCPRCRSDVLPGQPAVRCPNCGVFHHETEDRNCWTYAPTCAVCSQPTALDIGLQWTPETL